MYVHLLVYKKKDNLSAGGVWHENVYIFGSDSGLYSVSMNESVLICLLQVLYGKYMEFFCVK